MGRTIAYVLRRDIFSVWKTAACVLRRFARGVVDHIYAVEYPGIERAQASCQFFGIGVVGDD